jgi:hypothetical protein
MIARFPQNYNTVRLSSLWQKLQQLGDVHRNPPRLITRRPTGRPGPPVPTVLKRDVPHHTANSVISVNGTATRPR